LKFISFSHATARLISHLKWHVGERLGEVVSSDTVPVVEMLANEHAHLHRNCKHRTAQPVTRSSAIAEMPRDALCPPVVSFNSVILLAQSFIIVTWASD